MKINKTINIMACVFIGFSLSACAKKPKIFEPPIPAPTLAEIRADYIYQLKLDDVQVIHVGENIRIVLLDDHLFMPGTMIIRDDYKPVLNIVAKLIETYTKINVKVAGYLDNSKSVNVSQAFSTLQAQTVANYLWDQGVDARLLYAVGYNSLNPVDWNGDGLGRHFNRRVEISFRYYPQLKSYE